MNSKISLNDHIFIAGGTGMVGSSICRNLINKGYGSKKEKGLISSPTRKELDLTDKDQVRKWFKNNLPNVVIIAAAKVGGILANSNSPYEFLFENLKIELNLIEVSWEFNVKRLLFLGSSCIYPKFAAQPIKEDYLLSGELEKTNEYYAIAKIAGIKMCQALRNQFNFDAISLMPTNLYGFGDNFDSKSSHVLPALIKKFWEAKKLSLNSVTCWGTGSPLREFLFVEDLSEAIIFCLENWDPGNPFAPKMDNGDNLVWLNVGSNDEISIKELAHKIAKFVNYSGEILWDENKPDGTMRKKLDNTRINKLGWNPKISLDEGIKLTINDFIKNYS